MSSDQRAVGREIVMLEVARTLHDTCTFATVFSGIGGDALGLERAGWTPLWFSEIKPHACHVLARHWPNVPNLGDITALDWSTVDRPRLLAGGFPCQDLSHGHTSTVNGARRGLDGDASGLWSYFARAVEALEPQWVLVENVDTWAHWVPTVRADLSDLGYASLPVELSAGSFGAPHRRPRCFVVADANGDSESLLALDAEVEKLRPLSGRDRWNGGLSAARVVLLDDGVPRTMGELDAYGNAIVPAVAEWIGRWLIAHTKVAA